MKPQQTVVDDWVACDDSATLLTAAEPFTLLAAADPQPLGEYVICRHHTLMSIISSQVEVLLITCRKRIRQLIKCKKRGL